MMQLLHPSRATSGRGVQPEANFLHFWQESIRPLLARMIFLLKKEHISRNLALAQVYTYLPILREGRQILEAENECVLNEDRLQDFHAACCLHGIPLAHLGPMSKVWENGVVHVVQQATSLPESLHPVKYLDDKAAKSIAEVIYIPVYDLRPGTIAKGVVAVVELMVHRGCRDAMVIANLIGALTDIMNSLGLALTHAVQGYCKAEQEQSPASSNLASVPDSSVDSFGSSLGGLSRTPSLRMLL